jgi:hypothetical protein
MRSLAGIDHNHTVAMLDNPCVGWQPISPVAISEDGNRITCHIRYQGKEAETVYLWP